MSRKYISNVSLQQSMVYVISKATIIARDDLQIVCTVFKFYGISRVKRAACLWSAVAQR